MPAVGDRDHPNRDDDLASLGELQRVAEEVDDDLREAAAIADDPLGHVAVDVADQLDPFLVRARRHGPQDLAERFVQIELDRIEIDLAGLDLGEIEDVVDQREQRVARCLSRCSRNSRCSGDSGVSSASSVMPMMPFIGVRISWLMCARKSLFARFARSALLFGGLALDHFLLEIARALLDQPHELALATARAPDLQLVRRQPRCPTPPPASGRETTASGRSAASAGTRSTRRPSFQTPSLLAAITLNE